MKQNLTYDLIIIGAGPAGCSAALALSDSSLKVLLLDKDKFPRNKTCGDAIPGWALKEIDSVSGGFERDLLRKLDPHTFNRTSLVVPSGRKLTMNWTRPGYMIPRYQFDDFVLERVREKGRVSILEDCYVNELILDSDGVVNLNSVDGRKFKAALVIGADGPNSVVSKELAGYKVPPDRYGSAIRQYYKGADIMDDSESLVFFNKKFPSGYFWVFPLGQGRVNVGFGFLHGRRHRINSKEAFHDFIHNNPMVREMMRQAEAEGDLAGGKLPFALNRRKLSGDGFLLTGDAASLLDPFSGDGIVNAAKSGILAARWAEKAIKERQVNEASLFGYDKELYSLLWPELKQRARMMKLAGNFPNLVNLGVRIGSLPVVYKWLKSWV